MYVIMLHFQTKDTVYLDLDLNIKNKEQKRIAIKLDFETWGGRKLQQLLGERRQVRRSWTSSSQVNIDAGEAAGKEGLRRAKIFRALRQVLPSNCFRNIS